jgi:CHAT domain-containing protein/Tfp pilus assembly protein PilF
LNNLGLAYRALSRYEKAIGYYEQALPVNREVKDRAGEGLALNNLALVYQALSQYEKAISYYEQALAIHREVKNRAGEGVTLNNLGAASRAQSQYEKAIGYYEQAVAIHREIEDRAGEGGALSNLSVAYRALGQSEKAIGYEEQALAIHREVKNRAGEGGSLNHLGSIYFDLTQYEKAIGYEEQALAIRRAIKDRAGEGGSLHNLGAAYLCLGQYQKALGHLEQALAIRRAIKDRSGEGATLNSLGVVYRSLSQYETAIHYHEQALSISREVGTRFIQGVALENLMLDWKTKDQPRLAIFYGKQAVNTVQSVRTDIRGLSRELRGSFLKGNERPYHTLAELLISQGRLPEAEQVVNLLKEEEYLEFIRSEVDSPQRRAEYSAEEAEWEKRYRDVTGTLVTIGVERGALRAKRRLSPEETERLARLEQDLEAGNHAFQQFLDSLTRQFTAKAESSGRLEQLRESQGIMEDLRDLPPGTVAIYTLVGEEKYRTILVTPDVQKSYEYPIRAADLNRKVLEFREAVQDLRQDPRPLARQLYEILMGGMANDLRQAKAQTLMWSLDGVLRYLPLGALFDGESYVIERCRMTVFTPASNARLKEVPDAAWQAIGFGVTKAHPGASALPQVASELMGIISPKQGGAGVLRGEIKMDEEFTEQTMRAELRKGYPVVHIASHFHFQPGNEAKSFLLLGDGSLFTLSQWKRMPNQLGGVQLLTLSACNTGMGDNGGDGKEVEGFGVLAQRQGAKAVIASLWAVADTSTSLLMRELYRNREASPGVTKLEALQKAQLSLLRGTENAGTDSKADRLLRLEPSKPEREAGKAAALTRDEKAPYAHPYYWAPFFLMGNWL